jgi:hypothetical protein
MTDDDDMMTMTLLAQRQLQQMTQKMNERRMYKPQTKVHNAMPYLFLLCYY